MNIAVINAKDLFKNILKFFIIISIIFFLIKSIKSIDKIKKENALKQSIESTTKQISKYSFLDCLDISISLMSYTKTEERKNKILTTDRILAMGAGILDKSIYEESGLIINEEDLSIDDAEELANQIAELPENVTTEAVKENNITPKVTTSYGTVQINNQSKYEITEDILKPNAEITNKKDILIYHTHTCESYTPSSRIRVWDDRKL